MPCSVLGKNSDSSDTRNYKTDITADVLQGDKRVKVCFTRRNQHHAAAPYADGLVGGNLDTTAHCAAHCGLSLAQPLPAELGI